MGEGANGQRWLMNSQNTQLLAANYTLVPKKIFTIFLRVISSALEIIINVFFVFSDLKIYFLE